MGLTVFNQFPQLTRLLARIARVAAKQETQWTFNRIDLSTGEATLKDRAMNLVTLTGNAPEAASAAGGKVAEGNGEAARQGPRVATLSMPPMGPGRAHDLVVREPIKQV